MRDHTSRAFR